jgi:hypothetical protein
LEAKRVRNCQGKEFNEIGKVEIARRGEHERQGRRGKTAANRFLKFVPGIRLYNFPVVPPAPQTFRPQISTHQKFREYFDPTTENFASISTPEISHAENFAKIPTPYMCGENFAKFSSRPPKISRNCRPSTRHSRAL